MIRLLAAAVVLVALLVPHADSAVVQNGGGVTRLTGTSNEVAVSAATGAVTLSLPGNIANSKLANSSVTIAAGTGVSVSGCSPVALGGTCTVTNASPTSIVQMVAGVLATTATSSSGTYADSGITATITPTNANNKIAVWVSMNGMTSTNTNGVGTKLVRGASTRQITGYAGYVASTYVGGGLVCVDSPATTSATEYKITFARYTGGSGSAIINGDVDGAATSFILVAEVVGSTATGGTCF
jgi:hypothetical protein